jgi:hypothetical protein
MRPFPILAGLSVLLLTGLLPRTHAQNYAPRQTSENPSCHDVGYPSKR